MAVRASAGAASKALTECVEHALRHSSPRRWAMLPVPKVLSVKWEEHKVDKLTIPPLKGGRLRHLRMPYVTRGNDVRLYTDGDTMFMDQWKSIQGAHERIFVEMYSFGNDGVSNRTLRLLADAARRGVRVVVLYDSLGSRYVKPGTFKPLMEAGATVVEFNPLFLLPWYHDPRFRTHRKTVLVDDHAYMGGMNNMADYAGIRTGGPGRIWDVNLRLCGPAVQHIAQSIEHSYVQNNIPTLGMWRWLRHKGFKVGGRETIQVSSPGQTIPVYAVSSLDKILQSSSRRKKRRLKSIQRTLYGLLQRARRKVLFTTPYFLPQKTLRQFLHRLAERGRRVRVATAGNTDLRFMQWAASYLYGKFVRRGARIMEMYSGGRMLHGKAWIIDDKQWSVGSYNLDNTSRRNIELNLLSTNPAILKKLKAWITSTEKASQQITEDNKRPIARFLHRAWHWLTYRTVRLWGG